MEFGKLTSGRGNVAAAYEIANLVRAYGIDRYAKRCCESACTIVSLAGETKTPKPSSKIGFHQNLMPAEDTGLEYQKLKAEMGFKSPFEYAAWILERHPFNVPHTPQP